jgi:CHAT domain-containing protein
MKPLFATAVTWLALIYPGGRCWALGLDGPSARAQDSTVASSILGLSPFERAKALAFLRTCDSHCLSGVVRALTTEASKEEATHNLNRVAFLYDIAAEAVRQINDDKLLAPILYNLGRAWVDARNYQAAELSFLESAKVAEKLASKPDLINSLADLGSLYIRQGQYLKAAPLSRRCLDLAKSLVNENPIESRYGQAAAYRNLASIVAWQGDSATAIEYYQKSAVFFVTLSYAFKGLYKVDILDDLRNIGWVRYVSGDYSGALEYYHKALLLAEESNSQDRLQGVLNNLGLLYIDQGDYSKADELLRRALQIATKIDDEDGIITISQDLALLDQRQGKYESAVTRFAEVVKLAEKGQLPNLIIPPLEGLGSAYHKLGRYDLALRHYDRALEIAAHLGDRLRQSELNWWKGGVYYDLGEYDESITLSLLAAKLADDVSEPNLSYLALTQLGKARIALGQYESAGTDLLRAIERAERIRGRVGGQDQQRALFFEHKVEPYYLMVDLLIRQNKREEALLFAERARSRALLDLLGRGSLDIGAAISAAERDQEKRLDGQLTALNTQIYRESQQSQPDKQRLADLKAKIQVARVEYDSFLDRLYAGHPEVKVSRGQSSPLSLEELRSIMPGRDSAVLEFEVLEDKAYVFALSLGDTEAPRVNSYILTISAKALSQKVEAFRERIANRGLGVDKLSAELYGLLVAPAAADLAGKKTVVLVPDGILWELPFQALKNNDRFLIEDHAIFYAPSLTALREMMKRKQQAPSGTPGTAPDNQLASTLLAFGNPALYSQSPAHSTPDNATPDSPARALRDSGLQPLPESEREVQTLAKLYGPERSRVFIGADATEEQAKADMGHFSVLHFAAHGILDAGNPLYSHIVLSQAGTSTDDGLLEAREIMNMNLKADIAVLSACETARGRIGAGEGVIGLTWAFFAAGCPTTVVSQWSVESQSTTELMIEFHRNLLSETKMSKAEALRRASLKLLKTEKYRHPFYWAGFIVMGDGR